MLCLIWNIKLHNMKKALLLVSILAVSSIGFAQLNFGIKLGGNYNFDEIRDHPDQISINNAASWSVGGFVRIKLKKISLQGEALYVTRHSDIDVSILNNNIKTNFGALDVPLLVGYNFLDLKVLKFRVNGGAIPSFILTQSGDLEDQFYNDAFWSWSLGVSADIPFLLIDLRYQGALGDYANGPTGGSLRNNMVTLSVGWKIL